MNGNGAAAALFVLGTLAGLDGRGQAISAPTAAQNAPEMSTRDAPATFSTKVNLVMVPVVVRDSKGKAIGTLQKDDFQLFDKGKPQIISRFSVEKAGEAVIPAEVASDASLDKEAGNAPAPAAAPIAQRFVIYLFDDVHATSADLAQARDAAMRHLTESLNPLTRAAIFTTSGQGNVDFTGDRLALQQALVRLMARPTIGRAGSECPDLTYYMADMIVNKSDQTLLHAAAQEVLTTCAPPPPLLPNAAVQQIMQQAEVNAENVTRGTASRVLNLGQRDTRLALTVIESAIRRLSAAPGDRSLILVSPGFYIEDELRGEETDILDRAIRANVRISSLNPRGLYVDIPGGDASTRTTTALPGVMTLEAQYQRQGLLAEEGVLEELTYATGGRSFHDNNDLKAGFDQVGSPPEFVYLLGFSPQNLKLDGAYHALKVTLRNPHGLDMQARRGYYAPRHLADPEADAKREIQEALFSRDEVQDIPLELHTQFFKSGDTTAKIAVLARVNVRNLRFRKADGRNNDNLTVLSGVFDRNGNYISGIEKVVELHLLDPTLQRLLNSGITVRTNFDVAPGNYVIRLVVRDSEGQTMAARNGVVDIP
ncbi:MAG TPA: VWA domain-containing protein [Bryobacteraceae bacterium]|nr:VWA domain-containing protein [Bryobacteraceae bacterium]